jgi:two-component system, chemotaxis family, chemotaxis protein CheY
MDFSILIVDDSDTTRGLIKRAIDMAGLAVTQIREARNGKVALDLLRMSPADLVLADLHMPEMGGVELHKAIQEDAALKTTPLAIISAEPSATRIAALRQAGVKAYLRKPCTPEALRNLIQPFVEARHGTNHA